MVPNPWHVIVQHTGSQTGFCYAFNEETQERTKQVEFFNDRSLGVARDIALHVIRKRTKPKKVLPKRRNYGREWLNRKKGNAILA